MTKTVNTKILIWVMVGVLGLCLLQGCKKKAEEITVTEGTIEVINDIVLVENEQELELLKESGTEENFIDSYEENEEAIPLEEDNDDRESVDLIFFMGQSNMAGYGGNASKAPSVDKEAGEEFRVISDPTRLYEIEEPFGLREDNPNGLSDKPDHKKGSLVSAFINEYHAKTGRKVIAVSCSFGGMAMDLWVMDGFWKDCKNRVADSISWVNDNGFIPENIYIIWLQGESDAGHGVSGAKYREDYERFMTSLVDEGVQKVFIITPAVGLGEEGTGTEIIAEQKKICEEDDYSIMATTILSDGVITSKPDGIHFDQDSLNKIGMTAADTVADYTNNK